MTRRAAWLLAPLAVAALMLALTACGGGDESAESGDTTGATVVNATLAGEAGEYTFTLDKESVEAGKINFVMKNEGEIEHEFEVVKTDVAADDLPVEGGKADVEAEGGEEIGEVEGMQAGDEANLVLELEAGNYLIVCNLPGHYEQGMVLPFKVE